MCKYAPLYFLFFSQGHEKSMKVLNLKNDKNLPEKDGLIEEILKFLEDNPNISKAVELNLHKNILNRRERWITDGLPKKDREKLH